jgi:hypothetical protein
VLDPVAQLSKDGRGDVGRNLGDEIDADALGADEADRLLDLCEERIGGAVEEEVRLVEEEAELRLGKVARLGECVIQLGKHPEHERAEQGGLVHHVGELEDADDPLPAGRRPHQVVDVELRLPEEDVRALLLERDDRAEDDPETRRRDAAVVGQDRLAVVAA